MSNRTTIYLSWTMDCEATQKSLSNVELGSKAIHGFVDLISQAGQQGTLFALPLDAVAYAALLRKN